MSLHERSLGKTVAIESPIVTNPVANPRYLGQVDQAESNWRARKAVLEDKRTEAVRKLRQHDLHGKIRHQLSRGMSIASLERIYGKTAVRDVVAPTSVDADVNADEEAAA